MIPKECKRLAEVDFPIAAVSAHSAREKSIRHGHPSTLHLWWARRPLAACRSMLMALLLPDPCDANCPPAFKQAARRIMLEFPGRPSRWDEDLDPKHGSKAELALRHAILHEFIADFANWDNAANPAYLKTARALVKAAHGPADPNAPYEPPLVVDPFAGGGSIPLEALRIGCDAFASDLNPVACLINKVLLEDIPRHGPKLAEELRRVGAEIKRQAEAELAEFYPPDPDGARPIAYLWARTVRCEQPNCGCEIPLLRSPWLCNKAARRRALRYEVVREPSPRGKGEGEGSRGPRVEFTIFEPQSEKDVQPGTVSRAKATCPACNLVLGPDRVRAQLRARRGGAADARLLAVVTTRPGESGRFYRLPTEADLVAVRRAADELRQRMMRATDNGLSLVPDEPTPCGGGSGAGRAFSQRNYGMDVFADLFTPRQLLALTTLARLVRAAGAQISREGGPAAGGAGTQAGENATAQGRGAEFGGRSGAPRGRSGEFHGRGSAAHGRGTAAHGRSDALHGRGDAPQGPSGTTHGSGGATDPENSPPGPRTSPDHSRRSPTGSWTFPTGPAMPAGRQGASPDGPLASPDDPGRPPNDALRAALSAGLSRVAMSAMSLTRWNAHAEKMQHTFGRQALPIVWDFAEVVPIADAPGSWESGYELVADVAHLYPGDGAAGQAHQSSATEVALPSEAARAWFTDPPYYDAVPYADLSDFFYVWLKRALPAGRLASFAAPLAPKGDECIVDEVKGKDRAYFERTMGRAMAEGRRLLREDGVGAVVFAHKTTEGWEALLGGMIAGGWVITGSWPITTEMATRLRAKESAALAASVHLVCRPRDELAGVGDWGEIVRELPRRIGDWMERLSGEGIRGADLVFACIGPALELFSKYARVETPDGEEVGLAANDKARGEPARRGFLSYVWEFAGRTALNQVLGSAESRARNGAAGALEEDARLTALFLWTLQATETAANGKTAKKAAAEDEEDDEAGDEDDDTGEDASSKKGKKKAGLTLIYDVARRFAQPLGIHLDVWEGRIIETAKGVVRLLPVGERAKQLFGEDGASAVVRRFDSARTPDPQGMLDFMAEQRAAAVPEVKGRGRKKKDGAATTPESLRAKREATTLDRVHAAMLLQSSGATNALRALLEAETQRGPDFLRLANALSALYPRDSEEKRLLDAMLLAVPR